MHVLYFLFYFIYSYFVLGTVSFYSPSWPKIWNPPVSASKCLGYRSVPPSFPQYHLLLLYVGTCWSNLTGFSKQWIRRKYSAREGSNKVNVILVRPDMTGLWSCISWGLWETLCWKTRKKDVENVGNRRSCKTPRHTVEWDPEKYEMSKSFIVVQ